MLNDTTDINSCIERLSSLIYDISFEVNGKHITVSGNKCPKPPNARKQIPWFDNTCKYYKNEFYCCKRRLINNNTNENRALFLKARNDYSNIKNKAKRDYFAKEKQTLSRISKTDTRKFWKYINKFKNNTTAKPNNIDVDEFIRHFKNLSNTQNLSNFDANDFSLGDANIRIDELDRDFSVDEISKVISSLKRNKSSDLPHIVADFFIDSNTFIAPYLTHIFNFIFGKGVYPESWCKGAIVPIFKKGDITNPANYRGITLINIVAKIFSLALRNRIDKWCENNQTFNTAQYGFRTNRSTADCIYILHSLIQITLLKKHKLYCAFVDYEKAFDTVIHDALWVKLIQSGISSKMINMMKSIYSNVKACIKNSSDMSYSIFFEISLGVKQGEPLSPLLFILFINDVTEIIEYNNLTQNDLDILSVFMLLFADDIALFTTDPGSLQNQLNSLYQYSCKWGLKINSSKTKICIFEKRKSICNFRWTINNEILEVVDNFCYLGINFSSNGKFNHAVKMLNDQALKAYNHLLSIFSKVSLDIKTKLSLFDALVVPILLYGAEVWGIYTFTDLDKLHIKFCKHVLGVKQQTSNAAVFGELGRFPLTTVCKEKSIKYWLKIINSPNSLMHETLMKQIQFAHDNRINDLNSLWFSSLSTLLNKLGFGNLIDFTMSEYLLPMFSQRLKDQYIQSWHETLSVQPKMEYYCKFKEDFEFEHYLVNIKNEKHRKELTRFRLSSHSLEIETGRYNNIERSNRICKLCTQNVVESEYHFLLCCTAYSDLRKDYNISSNWPNITKFKYIMSEKKESKVRNTAKYIYNAMKLRKNKLES